MTVRGLISTIIIAGAVPYVPAGALPRYRTSDCMAVEVREYSNEQYPEDPARRSVRHGAYNGRRLKLVSCGDGRHFDFIFEPTCRHVAKVTFHHVDVSLMTPALPCHVKGDKGLDASLWLTVNGIDSR